MSNVKPYILVVDDTTANLHSMKKLLEQIDINVITAESGNEALTYLLKYDFMLILLDVHMPIIDGYETAELISQIQEFQHIPIIFITANDKERQHYFKGYEAGAVDYLFKPINPDILITKVKVFCKIYAQKAQLFEQNTKLDLLLEKKNELISEKDILLTKIKNQTRKLKITFISSIIISLIIIASIAWINSLIASKNAQLTNYTELLNEKNILFSDLKKAISENKNIKIQELLEILNEKEVKSLTEKWMKEPQFEWKKAENITEKDDEIRYKIVSAIAQIANIVAQNDKFIIPIAPENRFHETLGWSNFGTRNKKSDVDYSIVTIQDKDNMYSYNAIQGRKAVIASVIFRALFGSTSIKLLDTEFYPPSLGSFVKEPLSSRASFTAIFAQMANFFDPSELFSFSKELKNQCLRLDIKSIYIILAMLRDAESLHSDVESIRRIVPNPELANNIICNKITLAMTECGQEIDKLANEDPARKIYLDTFAFLDTLRTHFLPEGFISKGAFKVICEDLGGQKHQLIHRKIEEEALSNKTDFETATKDAFEETQNRTISSSQEYLESVCENGAFFHHRSELIDASKYGSRVYEGALMLIQMFNDVQDDKLRDDISAFRNEIDIRASEMSVLESEKRGKLFYRSFQQIIRKLVAKNNYKQEQISRILLAANRYFKNAELGGKDFVVCYPNQRIEELKKDLQQEDLGQEIFAIAESIARISDPIFKELLSKILFEEAQNEIIKMKERRKVPNISNQELFNLVKQEIRQTTAQLIAYALKVGVIQNPAPEDTELFNDIKAEVKDTIAKLIKNAHNMGIVTTPQLIQPSSQENDKTNYSLFWESPP